MSKKSADTLLLIEAVRNLFGGVSDMWIYRRLNDDSGFPRPIYLGRRRCWRMSELEAWIAAQPRENLALRSQKQPAA